MTSQISELVWKVKCVDITTITIFRGKSCGFITYLSQIQCKQRKSFPLAQVEGLMGTNLSQIVRLSQRSQLTAAVGKSLTLHVEGAS